MKKLIPFFLLLILSHVIVAQHSSNAYRKLADSLFKAHNYSTAATYYEKAIKNAPGPGSVMLQLAKCNQKMNRISDADKWYHDAKYNNANFTSQDSYDFVYILMGLQKRKEAESILNDLISERPGDLYAKRILNDLLTIEKYYKDSLTYNIAALSINTPASEFGPAYYKDGLVFSSAQPANSTKKKSPWDNSDYLTLYQSTKTPDQRFQKPVVLEEKLDSRYHDGPAVFYNGYDKMVVNRNQAAHAEGKKNTWIWHLSLYDAHYSAESKSWQLMAFPFDQPPYSTAHPFMTEDGNTLYFVSDRPGGYGGSDIYRSTKVNGIWGKPFNLGPVINSPGNEVFPFLSDNTLYFASNGQGGLGGLDIFKSTLHTNGFAPPVNVGYPINSTADDFSFITKSNGENGYFASSRNGNDDLFEFHKKVEMIKMLAYIYDGNTKQPIANAAATLISSTNEDRALTSDKDGYFHFDLSREAAYLLIGSHEGKSGMVNGFALIEEDHQHIVHQIPLFGDSTTIHCVGRIQNANGDTPEASSITIVDETTGKVIQEDNNKSIVDFRGEKGHTYRVEIKNKNGDVTTQQIAIAPDETKPKTWSMVLKDDIVMIEMAARIFNPENNQSLGGASVKISTFLEEDIDVVANENGIVEFSLKQGTAYLLAASKDSLNGIHLGEAELTTSKTAIVHPVPLYGKPENPLSVTALIIDDKGLPLNNADVTAVDKTTGQQIPVKVTNGLASFLGERGKEYDIQVHAEGSQPVATTLTIPPDANKVDEISIVLSKDSPSVQSVSLTAHVFKQDDKSPLAGAAVTVISLGPDIELKTDNDGNVTFTLPEGNAYILTANRDNYSGMYTGIVEKGPVLQVPTTRMNDKQAIIAGKLKNSQGFMLDEVTVEVTDKTTGVTTTSQFTNGLLGFVGVKGHTYTLSVEDKNHKVQSQDVTIPADGGAEQNIDLVFGDQQNANKNSEEAVSMTAHIFKQDDNLPLANAAVTIISLGPDIELKADKDGNVTFTLPEGNAYILTANRDNYSGMYTGIVEKGPVLQVPTTRMNDEQAIVAGKLKDSQGFMLDEVTVEVTDKATGVTTTSQFKNGLLGFVGVKGHTYTLSVEDKNHKAQSQDVTIPADGGAEQNIDLVFGDQQNANKNSEEAVSMTAHIFKQDDNQSLAGAAVTIISLGPDIELKADKDGNVTFTLPEGNAYILTANRDNYSGMYSGIVEKGPVLQVPTTRMNDKQAIVAGKLKDSQGFMLDEVTVEVTDKATGVTTTSQFKNGLLGFVGVKGHTYSLSVEAKNHKVQSQDVTIPADGGAEQNIDLVFGDQQNANKNSEEAVSMTAHIFKQDDNLPLADAAVTIISLGPDIELKADKDGNVTFTLPEGNAYILTANRDNYNGMYTGIVENGPILQVPTTRMDDQQAIVAGKLTDSQGFMLDEVTVEVTDKTTGVTTTSQFKNGLLGFVGVKGHTYTLSVEDKNHKVQSQDITISGNAGADEKISLVFDDKPDSIASTMIRLKNDGGDKFYISTGNSNSEITERNGELYANDGTGEKNIGNGTLNNLQDDPSYLKRLGLTFDEVIDIQNIYFDYNKITLDATDKKELEKAKTILQRYPHLQLTISAHADDRGTNKYNLNLSKRRAKAVESYLAKIGVNRRCVSVEAHGESVPAVPCPSGACNEEQREKNRRAEFSLTSSGEVVAKRQPVKSKTKTASHKKATASDLEKMLEKYGDKTSEGLSFKISIGAYRYNHTLTFDELKDLGTVEKVNIDGITYYYLASFATMRSAEAAKKEVIKRHVKDAFVSIFRDNERITFKEFLTMIGERYAVTTTSE